MEKKDISKLFGTTIRTGFGECLVEGFTEDGLGVCMSEDDEPFFFSIEGFIDQYEEYN